MCEFRELVHGFSYGYASADATPLYIIATNDYVTEERRRSIRPAKNGTACGRPINSCDRLTTRKASRKNFGFGHGWVEGGPLLPVKTELYQSGLGAQALSALSNLAHIAGKDDVSKQ